MVERVPRRLSAQDRTRIEAAIADLERQSAAELAIAIAQRSASYVAYPALWAACVALIAGWATVLYDPEILASHLVFVQAVALAIAGLLLHFTPLGVKLVPASIKRGRAATMARVEFTRLVHNRTRGKDGMLLYVSLSEHYIEIIADDAVAAEIAQDRWQKAINGFRARARRRTRLGDNLVLLIEECTAVLAARFPAAPGQANEMPNQVTEI
jgi:putative membrane protein